MFLSFFYILYFLSADNLFSLRNRLVVNGSIIFIVSLANTELAVFNNKGILILYKTWKKPQELMILFVSGKKITGKFNNIMVSTHIII